MPLVIARGGTSGLFPDQTQYAYLFAMNNSLPGTALLCDLQLTKDSVGICRTNIDLGASTVINVTLPNYFTEYTVNGVPTQGFFSIDLTGVQALNLTAMQSGQSRSPLYDGLFPILQPENVSSFILGTPLQASFWLNVEYASFFEEHKLDMVSYVLASLKPMSIAYVSSPEVAFLKAIQAKAPKGATVLVFKFNDKDLVDPSTNVTYGTLLNNLTEIATFAAGILVPKEFIWSVDNNTFFLGSQSTLVQDAHDAGLAVYVMGIENDFAQPIYNYSFDPIQEYLQYVPTTGPNVDGFLTDFPLTASEALACYRSASTLNQTAAKTKPLVLSHNGASGDYPGCTLLAYQGAVDSGASYIDCPIQITKDGIPICRESPDLMTNTDISQHPEFFPALQSAFPALQDTKGIFTFNMTREEISTLNARMSSPEQSFNLLRTGIYENENILTLSAFLNFAKNLSAVGIFIDIQNGYYLEEQIHLDVVGVVLATINAAGFNNSDRILIQSEDSAILSRLQQLTSYELVYKVSNESVAITGTQIQQIKSLAKIVTLPRRVMANSISDGFLVEPSNVVDLFHAQNMSVFIFYLRNEYVALPFDYEDDPTLELNTWVQFFKVDGLITDFPRTARAYLNNECLTAKAELAGITYPINFVIPGELLNSTIPPERYVMPSPPSGAIDFTENALPPTSISLPAPQSSPTGSPLPKAPASAPSHSAASPLAGPHVLVICVLLTASELIAGRLSV